MTDVHMLEREGEREREREREREQKHYKTAENRRIDL